MVLPVIELYRYIRKFWIDDLWRMELSGRPTWQVVLIHTARITYGLNRELARGELTLRAMGLVYITLLSLAPLLAVSFSVLKAFGVHNQIEPALHEFLTPLGDQASEVTANIVTFVDRMGVTVLGSLGLGVLIFTVLSLLQQIEQTFNSIWHDVPSRSLLRRFSDYLSVLLVGPVLVFSALGLTASMNSHTLVQQLITYEPFGTLYYAIGVIGPYLLIIAAFTFIYTFVPNTRVRFKAALTGAIIAGIVWKTTGWAFAVFVGMSTQYHAIYSAFSIVIIFMIWLYLCWLILLLGGQIAFFIQHPEATRLRASNAQLSPRLRERIGLRVMFDIARRFSKGEKPITTENLGTFLGVPYTLIKEVTNTLQTAGFIVPTLGETTGWVPARTLESIRVSDVLDILRRVGEESVLIDPNRVEHPTLLALISRADEAQRDSANNQSFADLVG